jgi:hypothetical protein
MAKTLLEKIRAARQSTVKVGDITLVVRRPTDLEMLEMRKTVVTQTDILQRFVDDWMGVNELHLFSGGSPDPVPFSKEIFNEWVADHPESWGVISEAVVSGYKAHENALADSVKN